MPATKKAKKVVKPAHRIAKSASSPKSAEPNPDYNSIRKQIMENWVYAEDCASKLRKNIVQENRRISTGHTPSGYIVRFEMSNKPIYAPSKQAVRSLVSRYISAGFRFSVEPVRIMVSE